MVYEHLKDSLWDYFSSCRQPPRNQKQILKDVLSALAALHSNHMVHLGKACDLLRARIDQVTDIKPHNILIDSHVVAEETVIDRVQLIDFENAMHLPPRMCVKGAVVGNENWRSPEVQCFGELWKPVDLFAFGAAVRKFHKMFRQGTKSCQKCIYTVLGKTILGVDDDFEFHVKNGALPSMVRLQRTVSYFGTSDGMKGLMNFLNDNDLVIETLQMLWEDRIADYHTYSYFESWDVNAQFKDLVPKLMDLNPLKKLTAKEALDHPWFSSND